MLYLHIFFSLLHQDSHCVVQGQDIRWELHGGHEHLGMPGTGKVAGGENICFTLIILHNFQTLSRQMIMWQLCVNHPTC